MPLPPETDSPDLDAADLDAADLDAADETEPEVWSRPVPLAEDIEAPEADALEQAQVVDFDEDGERR